MIAMELVDRTGRIKGVCWDGPAGLARILKAGEVYRVQGSVTSYKGENQITVQNIEPCKKFNPDDYLPRGDYSYEELEERLDKATGQISDSDYGGLLKKLFSDRELK